MLTHPTCICRPRRGDPFEFRRGLWCLKTKVTWLSCGIICVILCLAVLIQYQSVIDTHTDSHTMTAYTALSIASRGKTQHSINISVTYSYLLQWRPLVQSVDCAVTSADSITEAAFPKQSLSRAKTTTQVYIMSHNHINDNTYSCNYMGQL